MTYYQGSWGKCPYILLQNNICAFYLTKRMSSQKQFVPESIMVYLDITGDLISKKDVAKSIQKFAEEKLSINPDTTFGIILFEDDGNPFVIEETRNIKDLAEQIVKSWKNRNKTSFLENGLMYCLSVHAEKARTKQGTYRILVISDSPSNANSELEDALLRLVEIVRTFPTFIDIIRVGRQRFYKDDVKLRIIATTSSGGVFYGENEKDLMAILKGLAKNKKLPDLIPEGGQAVDPAHKLYYESLATSLEENKDPNLVCSICQDVHCNYCNNTGDLPKSCPQCGINYHECCAALYSWKNNIGLKHIFRCKNCGVLIKLNEHSVYMVNNEKPPQEIEYDEKTLDTIFGQTAGHEGSLEFFQPDIHNESHAEQALSDALGSLSENPPQQSIEQESPLEESKNSPNGIDSDPSQKGIITPSGKKIKYVRTMFGTLQPVIEGDSNEIKAEDEENGVITTNKPKEESRNSIQAEHESKEQKSSDDTDQKANSEQIKRRERKPRIKICSFCSSYVSPNEKICPKCQNPII